MNSYSVPLGLVSAVLLAPPLAHSQDVKPAVASSGSVHRLQITNGPTRTVHLVGTNVAPAEQQRLRDLARAENELSLVNRLQTLRAEYVDHEKRLERQRFETNYRLAGITHAYNPGIYPDLVPVVDPRILYESQFARLPYWYGGYGWGYPGAGIGYLPPATGVGSMLSSIVVEPGPLKTELVKGLASRATLEYAEQANRNYLAALSRAGESDAIAKAMGQPAGSIQLVAADLPREVFMKNGDRITGTLVQRDSDWVVLDTDAGRVELRAAEVTQIRTKSK